MSRPSSYFARLRRRKPPKKPVAGSQGSRRNREIAILAEADGAFGRRRGPLPSREPAAEF